MLQLDNTERKVEVGSLVQFTHTAFPEWDAIGNSDAVAGWLGNCSEHDREAIRALARSAAVTGQALRISFPSVLTFVMDYDGRGYRCCVPSDHDA